MEGGSPVCALALAEYVVFVEHHCFSDIYTNKKYTNLYFKTKLLNSTFTKIQ